MSNHCFSRSVLLCVRRSQYVDRFMFTHIVFFFVSISCVYYLYTYATNFSSTCNPFTSQKCHFIRWTSQIKVRWAIFQIEANAANNAKYYCGWVQSNYPTHFEMFYEFPPNYLYLVFLSIHLFAARFYRRCAAKTYTHTQKSNTEFHFIRKQAKYKKEECRTKLYYLQSENNIFVGSLFCAVAIGRIQGQRECTSLNVCTQCIY